MLSCALCLAIVRFSWRRRMPDGVDVTEDGRAPAPAARLPSWITRERGVPRGRTPDPRIPGDVRGRCGLAAPIGLALAVLGRLTARVRLTLGDPLLPTAPADAVGPPVENHAGLTKEGWAIAVCSCAEHTVSAARQGGQARPHLLEVGEGHSRVGYTARLDIPSGARGVVHAVKVKPSAVADNLILHTVNALEAADPNKMRHLCERWQFFFVWSMRMRRT